MHKVLLSISSSILVVLALKQFHYLDPARTTHARQSRPRRRLPDDPLRELRSWKEPTLGFLLSALWITSGYLAVLYLRSAGRWIRASAC